MHSDARTVRNDRIERESKEGGEKEITAFGTYKGASLNLSLSPDIFDLIRVIIVFPGILGFVNVVVVVVLFFFFLLEALLFFFLSVFGKIK